MLIQTAKPVYEVSGSNKNDRVRVVDLGDEIGILFGRNDDNGEGPWQLSRESAKNLFLALAEMLTAS